MISTTDKTFAKNVMKSDKLVVVDFWAEWCPPCKALMPTMEELSTEMKNVTFVKMNVDECPKTPSRFGVRGIPALILFKNGEILDSRTGLAPKDDIAKWINKRIK